MHKIALVTGANRGLGKAIAELLANKQLMVIIGARTLSEGKKSVEEIRSKGGQAMAVQLDVTDAESVTAAANTIREQYGKLDILINNAGILLFDEAGVISAEAIRKTYDVNVFGPARVIEQMLPLLKRSAHAQVINVSSEVGAFASMTNPDSEYYGLQMIGYTSSKTALNAITVQAAKIVGKDGIAVNAVNPGFLDTDLNNHTGTRAPLDAAKHIVWLALDAPKTSGKFYSDAQQIAW